MSSPSRTENGERIDAAQGTPAEIEAARHEVERAIVRLRDLGVDVDGMTEAEIIAVVDDEAAQAERAVRADHDAQVQRRQADIDHANAITVELEEARRRSGRLFGRKAAKRVVALELAGRLAHENIAPVPGPSPEPAPERGVVDLDALEAALAELKRADDQLERLLAPWDPKLPRRPRPWRPVTLP